MKEYTRAQLIKLLKASIVLSIPFIILYFVSMFSTSDDKSISSILPYMLGAVIGSPFVPFVMMGFLMNFKKILIGFIAPIPILSYFIEWFKGVVWAVKGIIFIIKTKNDPDATTSGNNTDSANVEDAVN